MTRPIATLFPVRPFDRLALDVDRAFDALWGGSLAPGNVASVGLVPVDIYEKEGALHFVASVPGIKPEELEVTVENDVLSLKGAFSQAWESDEDAKVHRREMRSGSFTRSFQLPENLDLDSVDATFSHGIVTVKIPIKVEVKPEPKRIEVKTQLD
ncbi:MAG: Hsp20/alpha crystallin family protein [Armatimonadetes bacterium]|nr:Hsp20/alpha crystallin family protein [Armatimonadota bacterium]